VIDSFLTEGAPVAHMLSSNGCKATLQHYFHTFYTANPWMPKQIMTDCNQAQINAVSVIWPSATIFLCWWHVLHAWQQHFSTVAYPELWVMLQKWLQVTTDKEFDKLWVKIRSSNLSGPCWRQEHQTNINTDKSN
jgi:MULE transposase domain